MPTSSSRSALRFPEFGEEPKKSYPVCLRTKDEVFGFIEANRQTYPVQMMCSLYGVTRGGFYAWLRRQPSERSQHDAQLLEQVRVVHQRSRGYYGSPRVTGQLRRDGH